MFETILKREERFYEHIKVITLLHDLIAEKKNLIDEIRSADSNQNVQLEAKHSQVMFLV